MLLHVPAIMLIAASMLAAFRSFFLISAISFSCSRVIFATLSLFGTLEPESILHARLMRTAAGGLFKMKEKDLLLILFFTLQKAVAKDQ